MEYNSRSLWIAILFLVLAKGFSASAQCQIKTLANGMTVCLNPIEYEEDISIILAYRAGANSQTASTAGLFKLLEYVLFNGPAANPGIPEPAAAIDVLEAENIIGGVGIDRFEFGIMFKKENLIPALDTFLYLFSLERREFILAQIDGIELAKRSVLALIQNETSDNDLLSSMAINKKLFSKAPFRTDILGAENVLEKADAAQLNNIASSWLVPNNACISIAGAFDSSQVMNLIEERFSLLPKAKNPWPANLPSFPKPGVTKPIFLVLPDSSIPADHIQIEMRYRGPDPKDTTSYFAALMLEQLVNEPTSRFQTAMRKAMPKGSEPENLRIDYVPAANSSWISVQSIMPAGKKPADTVFAFKEAVRGTELYMIKANPSYFSATDYEQARQALLEEIMAIQGDPLRSACHMASLWSWGIPSLIFQEGDIIMKTGQKEVSQFVDIYVQKNLEVVMVRIDPNLYEANKKSFSSYGFETVSANNAFWWR
ncbi:MAG TPA: insulinase family protein [Rectinema sp.]|nr:insulinase family protein [Rectinema sp.]